MIRIGGVITPIALVHVTGLTDVLAQKKDLIQNEPITRVQIQLTDSGLVQIDEAHTTLNTAPVKKKDDSIWNFWGAGKKGKNGEHSSDSPELESVSDEDATSTKVAYVGLTSIEEVQ